MKLSELFAKVTGFEAALNALLADKSKATSDTINSLTTGLDDLKAGTLAELATTDALLKETVEKLAASTKLVASSNDAFNAVNKSLREACEGMKLAIKEGASTTEMIDALKDGVATTLAKLNVSPEKIPAAKPSATQLDGNVKSRAEFEKLSHPERHKFMRSGGRLVD